MNNKSFAKFSSLDGVYNFYDGRFGVVTGIAGVTKNLTPIYNVIFVDKPNKVERVIETDLRHQTTAGTDAVADNTRA